MAGEEIYRSRVTPQAVAQRPLANADVYGAGLADAIGGVGDVGLRMQERERLRQERAKDAGKRLRADTELTAGAKLLADETARVAIDMDRLGLEHGPDYLTSVNERLQSRRSAVLDGLTDPRVRMQLERQLNDMDARDRHRAEAFDLTKQVKANQQNTASMLATLDNGIRTARDLPELQAKLREANEQWGSYTGGLELTDDAGREAAGREGEAQFYTTALSEGASFDPEWSNGLVASGQFNSILSERQMAQVQNAIALGRRARDAAQREAERAAEEAATEQKNAAMDALKAIKVRSDNGDPPPQGEIAAAYNRAKEAGWTTDQLAEYEYVSEEATRARFYADKPTATLQQRRQSLARAQAAGQLNAEGARELKQLDSTLDARAAQAGATLGEQWKSDPLGVAEQLRAMPRSEQELSASQLDPRALILARARPDVAERMVRGAAQRKAQPQEFMPKGDPKEAQEEFDEFLGPVLRRQLGAGYTEIREAALDYYVGSQATGGANAAWNRQNFQNSVRRVFGGSPRRDGTWQGGVDKVRNRMVELPDRLTASEFDRIYSRADLGKLGAVYSNGKPVDSADVRANYQPVVFNEDPQTGKVFYRLEDANGRSLKARNGNTFLLVIG